ncbi:PE family protein [Mycobacterium lacus]|uniref:PE domain-containing protein n=2 Tax=Mycobacterium lacus TaxID=169765 RepID=A0A7I7NGI2_9MYCO|nr:PE domain-containing protein [Mycobacterium lacus]BBX95423.1 hypothetical protein MLAC_07170 [Mycobacterium lacus]
MGYANRGSNNVGFGNTGNHNFGTGNGNSGFQNSGSMNAGSINTGDFNSGDINTGWANSGGRNTDGLNWGKANTGFDNIGIESSTHASATRATTTRASSTRRIRAPAFAVGRRWPSPGRCNRGKPHDGDSGAAQDEVSVAIASVFGSFGEEFQVVSARTARGGNWCTAANVVDRSSGCPVLCWDGDQPRPDEPCEPDH